MDTWRQKNDWASGSENSDDESDGDVLYKGREALIYVIDASLYQHFETFQEALKIIRQALLSGLLANDKDLIGILLANTEHSPKPKEPECLKNILVPDNCAVFLPLRQLTKDIVDYYLKFFTTAESEFINRFGIAPAGGEGNFANMIRLCCNMFQQSGFKLSSSIIVYLTDRTSPHQPQTANFHRAIQKARDLEEQNVEFQLIPMCDNFDYSIFYKEFLSLVRDIDLEEFVEPDIKQIRELLCDRKLKQDFNKRCLRHLRWTLGDDINISVRLYNYFQKKIHPNKVKQLRKDNSVVAIKRVNVITTCDPETNEITDERLMKPGDGWYELVTSSNAIPVTTETLNRLRNIHVPGMILLGFKHKSTLPQKVFLKACSFIYPDDSVVIGSKQLFRTLWQRCLDKEMIGVCLLVPRRKSKPRYVALIPVTTQDTNTGHSTLPGDGFKVNYLPMAKNYRHIDFSEWVQETSSPNGEEIFSKIIKKLSIKHYHPSSIKDPALSILEANLLALAFDISTEGGGKTEMPDPVKQDNRITQYLDNFSEVFGLDEESACKRKPSRSNEQNVRPPAKIRKITEDELRKPGFVNELIVNNSLSSLTVKQLHTLLEDAGIRLPKSTTKMVLIEKITEAFS